MRDDNIPFRLDAQDILQNKIHAKFRNFSRKKFPKSANLDKFVNFFADLRYNLSKRRML